jgi:hypothetical protein
MSSLSRHLPTFAPAVVHGEKLLDEKSTVGKLITTKK